MEPTNPVVALCAQGMQAEASGRPDTARDLFQQAWDQATDDYEACIAAHYLARHQDTPEQTLHWNTVCLERADKVGDARVSGFYPSLHLNLARAQAELGDPARAREHYEQAAQVIDRVPAGPYGDGLRFAVAAGLGTAGAATDLSDLFQRLCARSELTTLALLLPPYLGDLGTPEDRTRLLTALHMVHASGSLPDGEQGLVRAGIQELSG